jgi:hypothetical protein
MAVTVRITSRSFLHFLGTHGRKFRIQMGINVSG